MKSFKHFKTPSEDIVLPPAATVHKHSIYMQSRDSDWLNRNIKQNQLEEETEPLEEDIRD